MKNFREDLQDLIDKYRLRDDLDSVEIMQLGYMVSCLREMDRDIKRKSRGM